MSKSGRGPYARGTGGRSGVALGATGRPLLQKRQQQGGPFLTALQVKSLPLWANNVNLPTGLKDLLCQQAKRLDYLDDFSDNVERHVNGALVKQLDSIEKKQLEVDKSVEENKVAVQTLDTRVTDLTEELSKRVTEMEERVTIAVDFNRMFESKFCTFFGLEAHSDSEEGEERSADEAAAITEEKMEQCFEKWAEQLESLEKFRQEVAAKSDEYTAHADQTRIRLMSWRDTLNANSHLVEGLSAAVLSSQAEIRRLAQRQMTTLDLEKSMEVAKEQLLGSLTEALQEPKAEIDTMKETLENHKVALKDGQERADSIIRSQCGSIIRQVEDKVSDICKLLNGVKQQHNELNMRVNRLTQDLKITAIIPGNPTMVKAAAHGFQTGDVVTIGGLKFSNPGVKAISGEHVITVVSPTTFSLNGVNTSSLLAGAIDVSEATIAGMPRLRAELERLRNQLERSATVTQEWRKAATEKTAAMDDQLTKVGQRMMAMQTAQTTRLGEAKEEMKQIVDKMGTEVELVSGSFRDFKARLDALTSFTRTLELKVDDVYSVKYTRDGFDLELHKMKAQLQSLESTITEETDDDMKEFGPADPGGGRRGTVSARRKSSIWPEELDPSALATKRKSSIWAGDSGGRRKSSVWGSEGEGPTRRRGSSFVTNSAAALQATGGAARRPSGMFPDAGGVVPGAGPMRLSGSMPSGRAARPRVSIAVPQLLVPGEFDEEHGT